MSSATEKVEDAIIDLISAKEKIKELEEDVKQLAQRSNRFEVEVTQLRERLVLNNEGMDEVKETLEQALEVAHSLVGRQTSEIESLKDKVAAGIAVNKALVAEVKSISEDRDMWKESRDNAHKAFGALQDVVLGKGSTTETYDDLLAPVQELVNFKETVRSCLSMNYDSSCGKLAYELRRALNPGSTEERDSILSEIRKVLGAKDRNEDRPHETALQAAKRVVGDLNHLRYTNESQFNVLLATRKALGLSDSGENIIEEARKVKNASVALRHSYSRLAEAIGFTPHDSVDCVVAYAEDLKKNNGARTYTPPKGFSLVETEDYISKCQDIEKLKSLKGTVCTILGVSKENDPHHLGVRLRFEAEKFAKDSNDLKVIKEKLGLT